MRWPRSFTRVLLILAALASAAATAVYLVKTESRTLIGIPLADPRQPRPEYTWINLNFKEFHPAEKSFTGSMTIEVAPRWDQFTPETGPKAFEEIKSAFKSVLLRFDHAEGDSLTTDGGSDDPIALSMPAARGSFKGKGTFTWSAIGQPGPFFYPFDRYVLKLNPSLLQISDSDTYPIAPIDSITTEFATSNLIPSLHNLKPAPPATARPFADPYEITVTRPAILRALAIIVGALLLIWLGYLIWSAKPGEYAGQIVSLFVGVFSIRSSLLSGAPVFPSLIDYCALAVYLAAALIVLIKWAVPDSKTDLECPFCRSSIPLNATVCAHCTRQLEPVAVND